jgi:hypothetical protein
MLIESLESRVHLSLSGDSNGDHRVDSLDFNIVALHYNAAAAGVAQGDFNADAKCNALDFNVLAGNFGQQEIHMDTWNGPNNDPWETDADWLDGTKPTASDGVTIPDTPWPANPVAPTTVLSLATVDADGTSRDLSNLSFGDGNLNGLNGLTVNAVSGSVSGESNQGALTIASLTGVGKDLDVVAGSVVVTSFAANADYTIGGSTPESGNLTINGGVTTSIVRFTGGSQGGSPGASIDNWHGTIVSNKVGATVCAVNLGGSTLAADATLVSQKDGVTVTNGTGGTFSRFTKLRASGLDNTESTVTDGVEKSHARSSTYHGTYNPAWGFLPNQVTIGNYSGNPIAISASGGNWSLTLPDDLDLGSNQAVTLSVDGDTALLIDTITVTAAASGPGSVFGRTVVPAGMESIVLPQAIRDADSDLIESL